MNWEIRDDELNSKIKQYAIFNETVPVPRYRIYRNILQLIHNFAVMQYNYDKFVITSEYGDGGKSFMLVDKDTRPADVFKFYEKQRLSRFRVTEYLPDAESYSIHSVIGDKKIILSPIVKQIIEDNFLFRGVEFPCHQHWLIKSYTTRLSREIKKRGYRGICHFDFMKTPNEVYLSEINPRLARSTPFVSWMMRKTHSHGLLELDKMARKGEELPLVKKHINYLKWKMYIKDGKIEFYNET